MLKVESNILVYVDCFEGCTYVTSPLLHENLFLNMRKRFSSFTLVINLSNILIARISYNTQK